MPFWGHRNYKITKKYKIFYNIQKSIQFFTIYSIQFQSMPFLGTLIDIFKIIICNFKYFKPPILLVIEIECETCETVV